MSEIKKGWMDRGGLEVIIPLHEKDVHKLPSCCESLLTNLYFVSAKSVKRTRIDGGGGESTIIP